MHALPMTARLLNKVAPLLVLGCICVAIVAGQPVRATSPAKTFLPRLTITVEFADASNDSVIDAGEGAIVRVSIRNLGGLPAKDILVGVSPDAERQGFLIDASPARFDLNSGETKTVAFNITTTDSIPTAKLRLTAFAEDRSGRTVSAPPIVALMRELRPPRLTYVDYKLIHKDWGDVKEITVGDTLNIDLRIKNTGTGRALNVQVRLRPDTPGVELFSRSEGGQLVHIRPDTSLPAGSLDVGMYTWVRLAILADEQSPVDSINVGLTMVETREKFSRTADITFRFLQSAEEYEKRGYLLMGRGNLSRAAYLYEKALVRDPTSSSTLFKFGLLCYEQGNTSQAMDYAKRAAQLGNGDAKQWLKHNLISRTEVSYRPLQHNPFTGTEGPIGLGILPFVDVQQKILGLTEQLYERLKSKNEIRRRFVLYPFSSLDAQKATLGIQTLLPVTKATLARLNKVLGITFVVTGNVPQPSPSGFRMDVIRTSDSASVYTKYFEESETSTALDDAVRVFEVYKEPIYKTQNVLKSPGK